MIFNTHRWNRLMIWGALLTLCTGMAVAQTTPPVISNPEVIMTEESSAWVVFTTDVPTKATVEFRSTNGAPRTMTESGFETEHVIPLTGLIQGLTYEGTITVVTEGGATSSVALPPFMAMPPQVDVAFEAPPAVFFTGPDEAVIALSTNKPSTVEVRYGRNGQLTEVLRDDVFSETHALTLPNLLPNETYTFLVTVTGQDGSIVTTAPATFKVAPFERELTISRPEVFQTGEGSAFVVFTTSKPARVTVELNSATGMTRTISETEFETNHAILLPDLILGQTYSGRILATSAEGDVAIEFIQLFTATNEAREIGFELPPQVLVIGPDEAVVTFTTTVPSIARVDYGQNGMLDRTVRETTPSQTHALTLTGLQPNGSYSYIVTIQGQDGSIFSTAPASFIVIPAEGQVMVGDVDLDGFIDVRDVVLILRYIVKILPLTLEQLDAADVNRDGQVDVADAVALLRRIVNNPQ